MLLNQFIVYYNLLFICIIVVVVIASVFFIAKNISNLSLSLNSLENSQRVHQHYVMKEHDFPLSIILLNEHQWLSPYIHKVVAHYNKVGFNFFKFIKIQADDLKTNLNFKGDNVRQLYAKYNAKIAIAVVTNVHIHGSFEKDSVAQKKTDVLAHASLPQQGQMFICIDFDNLRLLKHNPTFMLSVLTHEFGHLLGLLDLNISSESDYDKYSDPSIKFSIMSSFNLSKRELPNGIHNPFDMQSLRLLYNFIPQGQH